MPGSLLFFKLNVNFQTTIVTIFRYRFFHFDINIKILFILHTKFQPKIFQPLCRKWRVFYVFFFIFSNSGHLEFSTRLNFTVLKPWSLMMLHMKFKIHACNDLRDYVI